MSPDQSHYHIRRWVIEWPVPCRTRGGRWFIAHTARIWRVFLTRVSHACLACVPCQVQPCMSTPCDPVLLAAQRGCFTVDHSDDIFRNNTHSYWLDTNLLFLSLPEMYHSSPRISNIHHFLQDRWMLYTRYQSGAIVQVKNTVNSNKNLIWPHSLLTQPLWTPPPRKEV